MPDPLEQKWKRDRPLPLVAIIAVPAVAVAVLVILLLIVVRLVLQRPGDKIPLEYHHLSPEIPLSVDYSTPSCVLSWKHPCRRHVR